MNPERFHRALPWLAFSFVAGLLVALCWRQIDVADFWWQYRTGKLIAESGIPTKDVFTFPSAGQPWIEMHWLFCLFQAWIVDHLGYAALNAFKALGVGGGFAFALSAANGFRRLFIAVPVLLLAVLAASHRFVVRPELVTYLCLGSFLFVIARWRERGGAILLLLPLIQAIWTNSHPLFLVGPFLLGVLWVEELIRSRRAEEVKVRLKPLSLALVLTFAACFLNPYGVTGVLFPFKLFIESQGSVFKDSISELKGPFEFNNLLSTQAFYVLALLATITSVMAGRKLDAFWTVVAASMLFLALSSVRNLPLFAIVAVPLNIHNLAAIPWKARRIARGLMSFACVSTSLVVGWLIVSNRLTLREGDRRYFGSGPAPNAYPVGCARYLKDRGFSGPVFNTLAEGSYLLAQGIKVYFDPRLEVPRPGVFEAGMSATADPAAFKKLVGEYGIRVAIVEAQSGFPANIALPEKWSLCYFDSQSAVFVDPSLASTWPKLDLDNRLSEIQGEADRWPEAAQIRTNESVTGFLVSVDQYEQAKQWASIGMERWPNRWKSYTLFARCLQRTGDLTSAIGGYKTAIEKGADVAATWRELAVCQSVLGDLEGAAQTASEATDRFPNDGECWAMRGAVELRKGQMERGLAFLDKAVQLSPKDPGIAVLRADGLLRLGRATEALKQLISARAFAPESFELNLELAITYHRLGQDQEARAVFEIARRVSPKDPRLPGLAEKLPQK